MVASLIVKRQWELLRRVALFALKEKVVVDSNMENKSLGQCPTSQFGNWGQFLMFCASTRDADEIYV